LKSTVLPNDEKSFDKFKGYLSHYDQWLSYVTYQIPSKGLISLNDLNVWLRNWNKLHW